MRSILEVFREARQLGIHARTGFWLILLQLAASSFEMLGLISFVPVFQFLNAHGNSEALLQSQSYWRTLASVLSVFGLPLALAPLLLITFAMLVCRQALTVARTLYEHQSREADTARIRADAFSRFLRASSDYQDKAASGGIIADMTQNIVQAVGHIYGRFGLAVQLSILLIYLAGMLLIKPSMTFLLVCIVMAGGLIIVPLVLKARRFGKSLVSSNRNIADFIVERMKLVRLVRISRMEGAESATIDRLAQENANAIYGIWRTLTLADTMLEALVMAIGLGVVYVAVSWLNVEVELVGVFLAFLLRLVPVARQVARTKQSIDSSRAAFDAVLSRLGQIEAARELSTGTKACSRPRTGIAYEHVSFAYKTRPDAPVLRNVSLEIPAGSTTAIVGPSGSGKSTLIDLLPRIRLPDAGRITLDGTDLQEFDLHSLRESVAYVSQTPLIFNVPLRDHITYGSTGASQEQVETAAHLAGLHETIVALPEGYDTKAGEGGGRLSGGQRQRLDLARALLSRAPLLVLDEPTASLDHETAAKLLETIEQVRRETETTILIISHYLPFVKTADQIVVMRKGRIEATGTHDQLVHQGGWYAETLKSQTVHAHAPQSELAEQSTL